MTEPTPRDSDDGSAILRAATGTDADSTGWRIVLEAALFTGVGALLLTSAGLPEAGIFSVFLGSAALVGRMNRILDENREAIWVLETNPWTANARTAVSLLALFVGMILAFAALAAWTGPADLRTTFGEALAGRAGSGDILSRRFDGGIWPLVTHNVGVVVVMMILSFIYRTYGVLLAIGWNAAVWAIVLTGLISRGLDVTPLSGPVFVGGAVLAVLPHLLLELTGYVVGTLGCLFASRGLTRYRFGDPRLKSVIKAASVLEIGGVLIVVLAAVVEHHFAPWMLSLLR